jgi:hypothetical protein
VAPDEPFTLARVRIDGGDGASGLARKLESLGSPDRRSSAAKRAGPRR